MRVTTLVAGMLLGVQAVSAAELEVWAVDPLIKVFRDARPTDGWPGGQTAEVPRGGVATFQLVARCDAEWMDLTVNCPPFLRDGDAEHYWTAPVEVRLVGYVPVDRPMQKPGDDFLDRTPGDYPDPLLPGEVHEFREVEILTSEGEVVRRYYADKARPIRRTKLPGKFAAGAAQPIWLTVPIPLDMQPGEYSAKVTVTAEAGGVLVEGVELTIRVHAAKVDHTRLWMTQWFRATARHMEIDPAGDSPEFYALLGRYALNMAEHRQNVALISPLRLCDVRAGEDGGLAFDFERFDRWVAVFQKAGVIGRIEGGHIGGRSGDWESPFHVFVRAAGEAGQQMQPVAPDSAEAEAFHRQFLPALVEHLKKRGWLDIYMQHLADEPIGANLESYRAMAALVERHAPELRVIEATHTSELTGAIDVWVPQLDYWERGYDHYVARQKAGDEVWFYTCVFPQGDYANRFIEQPLLKTRLLPWIAFRYGATGYLHWGYNQWTAESPFEQTTRPHGYPPYLPAGDAWIVYPGEDGPLDSIRWEAMRDGIVDHELLSQLADRDEAAAEALAKRIVRGFDEYEGDVEAFRAARRELLERLSQP